MAVPAAAALVLAAGALALRASALVPWGLGACGAAYAAALIAAAAPLDLASPLYAAGLLVSAELVHWSLEDRGGRASGEVLARRAALVGALGLATAGAGAIVLGFAQVHPAGGPLVLAAGLGAAIAALALLVRLAAAAGRRA